MQCRSHEQLAGPIHQEINYFSANSCFKILTIASFFDFTIGAFMELWLECGCQPTY
jgi:hypothetical protein